MLLFAIVLVFIIKFLAAGLVVLIVWFARQTVQPKTLPADLPDQADAPRLLREEKLSTITPWAAILERFDFIEIMKRQIAQADLEERQRLWTFVTSKYREFENYQKGNTREIPVVILTPQQ